MRNKLHVVGAALFGVILSVFAIGAGYNQFFPGGALSGTWNSQNVNVAAGAPFIAGTLPAANGGTGAATLSGVLKGNGTSALSAALSSDVIALWSGTCNGSAFLRGDGACAAAGTGSVTSVALTAPAIFSVAGTPVTTSGTLAISASGTSGGIPYFDSTTTLASSGVLTGNRLVLGGGAGSSPAVLGSLGTTTTLLHGNAAGAPTFAAVALANDVSGTLAFGNGGTGVASAAADTSLISTGAAWTATAVPSCSTATSALTYDTGAHTFGCNSSAGGGVTQSTGTGTLTYAVACTVDGLQNYAYVLTGMEVTLTFTTQFACTSDSTSMVSDALPASIRPARTTVFGNLTAQDASGVVTACFSISTAGVLTWFKQGAATGGGQCTTGGSWTASGTKGPLTLIGTSPFIANVNTFTYTLN